MELRRSCKFVLPKEMSPFFLFDKYFTFMPLALCDGTTAQLQICSSERNVPLLPEKTASNAAFFRRRYFYYGVQQKLYNVLGGFYGYYNSMNPCESVHKPHKKYDSFLVILYK
nr:MAG TPA: hypothetical protein [Bacteriophage sp.]